jgi:hypothetical protein
MIIGPDPMIKTFLGLFFIVMLFLLQFLSPSLSGRD